MKKSVKERFLLPEDAAAAVKDATGSNVLVGVEFGRYLLLGLRYQEAWTNVNMSLVSQAQRTQSQSWGLRAAVKLDGDVVAELQALVAAL